ncbi:MAG: hypothetical protein DWH79_07380 [Planctomycetota bacterium]|nr:MAG: hypothetical protein DWH79_07380 [Planctomycetota bacterium]
MSRQASSMPDFNHWLPTRLSAGACQTILTIQAAAPTLPPLKDLDRSAVSDQAPDGRQLSAVLLVGSFPPGMTVSDAHQLPPL